MNEEESIQLREQEALALAGLIYDIYQNKQSEYADEE